MREKEYPHQIDIRSIFRYCETGNLYWIKYRPGCNMNYPAGGGNKKSGYIEIQIDGSYYQLHRLIYIYHKGIIPVGMVVDHISGDNTDNRISNLQCISSKNNSAKQKLSKNNKSGFKGVSLNKKTNRWRAIISPNGKQISLGYYEHKEDAAKAYDDAAIKYYGSFAKLNFAIDPE